MSELYASNRRAPFQKNVICILRTTASILGRENSASYFVHEKLLTMEKIVPAATEIFLKQILYFMYGQSFGGIWTILQL